MRSPSARRRIDGLIIVPAAGTDHSYLARERDAGIALVFVDRPPAFLDADAVLSDNAEATTRAVLGFGQRGHSRIAFLCDRIDLYTAQARLQGYREALAQLNIPEDPSLVRADLSNPVSTDSAVRELFAMADPPTALFTAQNLITTATLHTLRALELHRSVALIGFDDIELADLLEPPVTVVAQDATALGRTAAELLFARIDGDCLAVEEDHRAHPADRARLGRDRPMILVAGEALMDLVVEPRRLDRRAFRWRGIQRVPHGRTAGGDRRPSSARYPKTVSARFCAPRWRRRASI